MHDRGSIVVLTEAFRSGTVLLNMWFACSLTMIGNLF
jgi:hypothetical protein